MTKIKPGGKSESERRSATISAVTVRPRSTSTLMSSGTRPRHARNWSELWSLYRMSSLEALPLIAFYKLSSPLNVRIDFDQTAVALGENARPQQGATGRVSTTLRNWVKAFADDPQDAFPGQGRMKPGQLTTRQTGGRVALLKCAALVASAMPRLAVAADETEGEQADYTPRFAMDNKVSIDLWRGTRAWPFWMINTDAIFGAAKYRRRASFLIRVLRIYPLTNSRFRPPAPRPQARPLGPLALLKALRSNPLECWTDAHFNKPSVTGGFPFARVAVVRIRRPFARYSSKTRRSSAKTPLSGACSRCACNGLVTVSGEQCQRQRRVLAPMFGRRMTTGFAPAMAPAMTAVNAETKGAA
jgi:hypothetical protein